MAHGTPPRRDRPLRSAPRPPYGSLIGGSGSPRSPAGSPQRGGEDGAPLAQSLQLDILRSRLTAQQADCQKLKRDLEESREKSLSLGIKLNEERMQKVALTHRYTAVVDRVKDIDERMREAEEVMQAERRQQREMQRTIDLLRDQVRQKQSVIDSQAGMLSKQQAGISSRESGMREDLERREGQQVRLRGAAARCVEHCGALLRDAVARMGQDRESRDAAVTVLCSELTTTATEAQQGLQRAELQHDAMREQLATARAVEEEYSNVLITMLRENKELWAQLEQRKTEVQRLKDEERRKGRVELQEQVDALTAEKRRAEEQLRGTKDALSKHIRKADEHERNFAQVMGDLHAAEDERGRLAEANAELQQSAQALEEQLAAVQRGVEDADRGMDAQRQAAAALQVELSAEREQARAAAQRAAADVAALRGEHDRERGRLEGEVQGMVERLAGAASDRERLQGDALLLREQCDAARQSLDDERAVQAAQLRDDLAVQRAMYEREVEALRRDVSARDGEIAGLQRASDRDRLDATSLRMELDAAQARAEELRRENTQLHDEAKRLLEERQARARELDEQRSAAAELAGAAAEHDRERAEPAAADEERRRRGDERRAAEAHAAQATQRAADADARRQDAERELRKLQAEWERGGGARARGELERDKALLVKENERILAQYASVNEQNTRLLAEQRRLQERAQTDAQLRDELAAARRQAAQQQATAGELDDARGALSRAEDEVAELRRERDATQQRLDRLLDESKRKDIELDLPACVEAADQQIRRLEQQMEAASFYTARRNRSPGRVAASPLSSEPSAAGRARGAATPARPTR